MLLTEPQTLTRVQPLLSTPRHQYKVESEGIGLETGRRGATGLSLDWRKKRGRKE